MLERTKQFCDSFLELGMPGFDLAVYKDGQCVCRYWNGYSDLENKKKMNGAERYNIYSCSKVITCTAALQLWEKGMFSLEDKLSDYMPEFENMTVKTDEGIVPAQNPILIKHLFEMTAGFTYCTTTPAMKRCREETNGMCPTRDVMRYLAEDPLSFEPGTRWQYSLCHDVLAALVEVLSGEKFEDYVRKNIFEVVNMGNSTFMLPESEVENLAAQYAFQDGKLRNIGKHIDSHKLGSAYASGGAGAISTVDDYMRFLEGLRTYKLLKPETVKQMQTDRLTWEQKGDYWARNTHGYGLGVRCPKGDAIYTDFGWSGAAGACLAVDIENGISMYFALHVLTAPVQGLSAYLFWFIKAELYGIDDWDSIRRELKTYYNYDLI